MIRSNFHTHSSYSDGNNEPEVMVQRAIEFNFTSLGFSDHAPGADYVSGWSMTRNAIPAYVAEIHALKEKYKNSIDIYCGLELDSTSELPLDQFDYTIGSVHTIKKGGVVMDVDLAASVTEKYVKELYGGDYYAYAKDYYESLVDHNLKNKCDIVGHFDLIAKFNENQVMFDDQSEEYGKIWKPALEALLEDKSRFVEVNTGAISGGHRTVPYPTRQMLEFIKQKGGTVIITTDCHRSMALREGSDVAEAMIADIGVNYIDFGDYLAQKKK